MTCHPKDRTRERSIWWGQWSLTCPSLPTGTCRTEGGNRKEANVSGCTPHQIDRSHRARPVDTFIFAYRNISSHLQKAVPDIDLRLGLVRPLCTKSASKLATSCHTDRRRKQTADISLAIGLTPTVPLSAQVIFSNIVLTKETGRCLTEIFFSAVRSARIKFS